ncbi:MAG TPA: cytoplasmic protein [Bacteroidetes bacterium]|nr:cytoplasmic protein [Bacteroidota bacterium]
MESSKLKNLIQKYLAEFYERRLVKFDSINLNKILKRKNPYLYRSISNNSPEGFIDSILAAFLTSSDEGIFGDAFFEPLAREVSGGVVSPSEGVDVAVETDDRYLAVSVKSGPNIYNASQAKRQNDEFVELRNRLKKMNKRFDALLGHCYGQRNTKPSRKRIYRELFGQEFWAEITGDNDFYKKLITLIDDKQVRVHLIDFERKWEMARNLFLKQFLNEYCKNNGEIDWERIVEINSGSRRDNKK